jgi:hypothetical protein
MLWRNIDTPYTPLLAPCQATRNPNQFQTATPKQKPEDQYINHSTKGYFIQAGNTAYVWYLELHQIDDSTHDKRGQCRRHNGRCNGLEGQQ